MLQATYEVPIVFVFDLRKAELAGLVFLRWLLSLLLLDRFLDILGYVLRGVMLLVLVVFILMDA